LWVRIVLALLIAVGTLWLTFHGIPQAASALNR
jgi:hypothetical protein